MCFEHESSVKADKQSLEKFLQLPNVNKVLKISDTKELGQNPKLTPW